MASDTYSKHISEPKLLEQVIIQRLKLPEELSEAIDLKISFSSDYNLIKKLIAILDFNTLQQCNLIQHIADFCSSIFVSKIVAANDKDLFGKLFIALIADMLSRLNEGQLAAIFEDCVHSVTAMFSHLLVASSDPSALLPHAKFASRKLLAKLIAPSFTDKEIIPMLLEYSFPDSSIDNIDSSAPVQDDNELTIRKYISSTKLDSVEYNEKLTKIFRSNNVTSLGMSAVEKTQCMHRLQTEVPNLEGVTIKSQLSIKTPIYENSIFFMKQSQTCALITPISDSSFIQLDDVMSTIIGMMNSTGGDIFIGVDPTTRHCVGLKSSIKNVDTFKVGFDSAVAFIDPTPAPDTISLHFLPVISRNSAEQFCIIHFKIVKRSPHMLYSYKFYESYIREDIVTKKLNHTESLLLDTKLFLDDSLQFYRCNELFLAARQK